ncbi:hypothetical protein NEOKW01_1678 [Nematocida sp. AWRm80]|nr:hypothetical protein NEOKW01_1678 [Nematocida sp. AWRm80]
MIMSLRPHHERLLREIYKKDGSVDEQKLSFFKHYLQQKPMKISETMRILKDYTKKYALNGQYNKHITSMVISSHLIKDYSMFCTSFEIAALKLVKTHLKECLRVIKNGKRKYPEQFVLEMEEEIKKCFFLFTYAGTRTSKSEKIATHIFLALCSAIDSGFNSERRKPLSNMEMYESLTQLFSGKWGTLSLVNIKKKEEEERESAGKNQEDEEYSIESSLSYNFADASCNYTEDKTSTSSSFFSVPDKPDTKETKETKEPSKTAEPPTAQTAQTTGQNDSLSNTTANGQGLATTQKSSNSTQTGQPQGNTTIPSSLNSIPAGSTNPSQINVSVTPPNGLAPSLIVPNSSQVVLPVINAKEFLPFKLFVIRKESLEEIRQTDNLLLTLLSILTKASGILVHHTEKKISLLNRVIIKPAPFNMEMRYEIFSTYFQVLPPTTVPTAAKQVIEIATEREIPAIHQTLHSLTTLDLYSDLIMQSNSLLMSYRTKIFEVQSVDRNRKNYVFLLLQTVLFVNSIQVNIPSARLTKSFYFLLRTLFPKKTIFRKVIISDIDMQERALTIKYFKLFISKCQDKETIFVSLLRRSFQKEAGIGSSSVPSDLKLLISKELEQNLLEMDRCSSLSLLELLLDIANSPALQFREYINSSLELIVEKGVLAKRSQFEEHKRNSIFAKIRTHAISHGGLYISLLKKSLPTISISEIKVIAGVFSVISEVSGLEECSKYIDIPEGTTYDQEEDNRLCNRDSSIQGSTHRSDTTFEGVRKTSIRLFDMFRRLNK